MIALAFAIGSDPVWALFFCAILAALLIAYTFYVPVEIDRGTDKSRVTYLRERKEQVYENLRDLNFEYKAGKFPEADYQQMRRSLEDEAAALLAEIERLEAADKNPLFRGVPGALKKSPTKGA
ncbi:MAG TPA: hypothetical protein VD837_14320 [Terriglobales bacterium]|nr:hypothetical protein [Terriglobales bacterium]